MTDLTKLKELAERAIEWGKNVGDESWYPPEMFTQPYFSHSDADFLAAANPQAILGLIAEVERLRKDAERYRFLCGKERGCVVVRDRTSHLFGESLDAAIDAALEGGGNG